jgi:hypothetical protein
VSFLANALLRLNPEHYSSLQINAKYPGSSETCDLCVGTDAQLWEWAVELKYARMKRSDGRMEEAALSRVLSPYRESAALRVYPW